MQNWEDISHYKYRSSSDEYFQTGILGVYATTDFITMYDDGRMLVKKWFLWNGASGPTIDTDNTKRASKGHDALYTLIALGVLNRGYRRRADRLLRKWLLEDGMAHPRAQLWYEGVRAFGGLHL